jgi:hypothetical protein
MVRDRPTGTEVDKKLPVVMRVLTLRRASPNVSALKVRNARQGRGGVPCSRVAARRAIIDVGDG